MKYPGNITGPQFANSDLLEFTFKGAELTLPLPEIPANDRRVDDVSTIKDFSEVDTESWERSSDNSPCYTLVTQKWNFEDAKTFDDIASCWFEVTLMEVPGEMQESLSVLSPSLLKKYLIESFSKALEYEKDEHLEEPDWPKAHNSFNYKCIKRSSLDWMQIQVCFSTDSQPSPLAFIPIDRRFVLSISFHMSSMHYADRKNPYSDELIRQLEFDLFDEYLQNINLRYTAETRQQIKSVC